MSDVMFCPKCHLLCREECPKCGARRKLRAPEPEEPVLLIILTTMQAMLVEPVLQDNHIPYYKMGESGAALAVKVGMMRQIYRFYVSYSSYETSCSLIEQVFGEDETIIKLLNECSPDRVAGEA